jgi:hypothetical protein
MSMNYRILFFISVIVLLSCKGSQQKSENDDQVSKIDVQLLSGTWYKHPDESGGKIFSKDRSSVPPARFIEKWYFDLEERMVSITSPGSNDRPNTTRYSWKLGDDDQLKIEGFDTFRIVHLTKDSIKFQ